MKIVIQRVTYADVKVENKIVGSIDQGFLVLVGFGLADDLPTIKKLAKKTVDLRVFEDENGKMNLSLKDVNGKILSISQFTLYGDVTTGRRPSFTKSAKSEQARELYNFFNQELEELGIIVEKGIFQAEMKVSLTNDGPVTIIIDSEDF